MERYSLQCLKKINREWRKADSEVVVIKLKCFSVLFKFDKRTQYVDSNVIVNEL